MNATSDLVTTALVGLFSAPGSALAIAFLMLLGCTAILLWVRLVRVGPLLRATNERVWRLSGGAIMPGRRRHQRELVASSSEREIMEQAGAGSELLRKAWEDYVRTRRAVAGRTRATSAAAMFFRDLPTGTSVLGWWANLFVAVGLVFTFLGVVAALTTATATIGGAGDQAATQAALADLLTITATKFWTSIAGVGSSILLRVYERRWRSELERRLALLGELLDSSAEPLDPAELMARQLDILATIAERLDPVPPRAVAGR